VDQDGWAAVPCSRRRRFVAPAAPADELACDSRQAVARRGFDGEHVLHVVGRS
jgi:hypothetical protein